MKSATTWFSQYGESHQNPINKAIHWVCIPVILLATLGLFMSIPHPFGAVPYASFGTLLCGLALVFYFRLSLTVGIGMALVLAICVALNVAIANAGWSLPAVSAALFVVAWAVQFVGHKIEGKKPSFFEDIQFLLVGPAWLLQFVLQKVGLPVETWRRGAPPMDAAAS